MKLNKELFVLPEKWCVRVTDEILDELIKLRKSINRPNPENIKKYAYCVVNSSTFSYGGNMQPLHKEITTEQFKQHFMKDKEIIGYKLIKPEYKEAALAIVPDYPISFIEDIYHIRPKSIGNANEGTDMYKRFKKAGVLDLWFEPVYKAIPRLPEIDGYYGVFSGGYIVYGCAKLSIGWFICTENRHIKTLQLNSGVYISEEQMHQIREAIEYNK